MDGDSFKANEMMIDCLLKSTARGKWTSFLKALEESGIKQCFFLLCVTLHHFTGGERPQVHLRALFQARAGT